MTPLFNKKRDYIGVEKIDSLHCTKYSIIFPDRFLRFLEMHLMVDDAEAYHCNYPIIDRITNSFEHAFCDINQLCELGDLHDHWKRLGWLV